MAANVFRFWNFLFLMILSICFVLQSTAKKTDSQSKHGSFNETAFNTSRKQVSTNKIDATKQPNSTESTVKTRKLKNIVNKDMKYSSGNDEKPWQQDDGGFNPNEETPDHYENYITDDQAEKDGNDTKSETSNDYEDYITDELPEADPMESKNYMTEEPPEESGSNNVTELLKTNRFRPRKPGRDFEQEKPLDLSENKAIEPWMLNENITKMVSDLLDENNPIPEPWLLDENSTLEGLWGTNGNFLTEGPSEQYGNETMDGMYDGSGNDTMDGELDENENETVDESEGSDNDTKDEHWDENDNDTMNEQEDHGNATTAELPEANENNTMSESPDTNVKDSSKGQPKTGDTLKKQGKLTQ